tara:strand:+ start:439 stop:1233 length:795 start_codon:yes stop_codon:yes gene_type:complete
MYSVGVLGCGWLGISLAKKFKKLNYQVLGSKTSLKGLSEIEKFGIEAYIVVLKNDKSEGILPFIKNIETLIISVPPQKKSFDSNFTVKIQTLINSIKSSSLKKILFLSSTSVYGSKGGVFDETKKCLPNSRTAQELYDCEKLIKGLAIPTVIVRLGGLIGEDRNPIYHLQNKIIKNPNGRINFIHRDDAVNGISTLVTNKKINGLFNLVSPHHPTRKSYYKYVSKKYNLKDPKFENGEKVMRIINGDKITRVTKFNYSVDNLLI